MTQKTYKNFISVLKFLKEGVSKEFIENELEIKTPTFYKYLNLIKKAGFDIEKNANNYKLRIYNNLLDFKPYEESILAYLAFLSYYMLPNKKTKIFKKTFDEILKLSNKNTFNNTYEKYNFFKQVILKENDKQKINLLQQYIENSSRVRLVLKNSKALYIKPVEFVYGKEKIYLRYIDLKNKENDLIPLKSIKGLSLEKERQLTNENDVIFELYGRLKKSYRLKEGERIMDNYNDKLIIANSTPDKNSLFKRLLRYDTLCKVIYPKEEVSEFKKIIYKSLENLNKIQDNSFNEFEKGI